MRPSLAPSLFRASLAFCGFAQFLDVWTTERALKVVGTTEANPAAAWLMETFGSYWCAPKYFMGVVAIGAAFYLTRYKPSRLVTFTAFTIAKIYALVLVNNYFGFV